MGFLCQAKRPQERSRSGRASSLEWKLGWVRYSVGPCKGGAQGTSQAHARISWGGFLCVWPTRSVQRRFCLPGSCLIVEGAGAPPVRSLAQDRPANEAAPAVRLPDPECRACAPLQGVVGLLPESFGQDHIWCIMKFCFMQVFK